MVKEGHHSKYSGWWDNKIKSVISKQLHLEDDFGNLGNNDYFLTFGKYMQSYIS